MAVQPRQVGEEGLFYDDDTRLDLTIRETMRGAYMRVEYLNWDIQKPGNHLIGAPLADVDNPTDPFLLQTPTSVIGVGEMLSGHRADFSSLNGVRGTVGLPFEQGLLEGNVWGLTSGNYNLEDNEFLRDNNATTPRFITIGLKSDGVPGSRLLLFDDSFRARYSSSAWGGDLNLYYNQWNPRMGVSFQPLFGFRYLQYGDKLGVRGTFSNVSGTLPGQGVFADPIESRINSDAQNNVYSLQTGFRTEFRHQWFTLGFEPKIAFGANDYRARVTTSNLRDFDDPTVTDGPFDVDDPTNFRTSVGRTLFTPTVDLGVYAKIHLSQWAHLRVGYTFMLSGNIVRSDRAIDYNDQGVALPPAVVAKEKSSQLFIQGLTVGGEFILP